MVMQWKPEMLYMLPKPRGSTWHLSNLLPLAVAILFLPLLLRVSFIVHTAYLLLGIYPLARVWSHRSLQAVRIRRVHDPCGLIGDSIRVRLDVENHGLWPVPWIELNEHLPRTLASPARFECVAEATEKPSLEVEVSCDSEGRT